jgi:hypothetical protein
MTFSCDTTPNPESLHIIVQPGECVQKLREAARRHRDLLRAPPYRPAEPTRMWPISTRSTNRKMMTL